MEDRLDNHEASSKNPFLQEGFDNLSPEEVATELYNVLYAYRDGFIDTNEAAEYIVQLYSNLL